jgi:hypothetical protein
VKIKIKIEGMENSLMVKLKKKEINKMKKIKV